MELFYSYRITDGMAFLDAEESAHCVKVLRHRTGDDISVIDGCGNLLRCSLADDSPKGACARIISEEKGFGSHPYHLTMAVCPTKNNDRYEWFVEKATEIGVDVIAPVIGEHSERKVYKTDRARKIVLSAAKQSLKAALPEVQEPESVIDFIYGIPEETIKLFACCFEGEEERISIKETLSKAGKGDKIAILIGPEGDFSKDELEAALRSGWRPVHLGDSRLRTETAAVFAAAAVYEHYL